MSLPEKKSDGIDVRTEGVAVQPLFGTEDYRSWIEEEIRGAAKAVMKEIPKPVIGVGGRCRAGRSTSPCLKIATAAYIQASLSVSAHAVAARGGAGRCLTLFRFPREHGKMLRTSNPLEPLMEEIRRRTKVAEQFPHEESALSLVAVRLKRRRELGRAALPRHSPAPRAGAVSDGSGERRLRRDAQSRIGSLLHSKLVRYPVSYMIGLTGSTPLPTYCKALIVIRKVVVGIP